MDGRLATPEKSETECESSYVGSACFGNTYTNTGMVQEVWVKAVWETVRSQVSYSNPEKTEKGCHETICVVNCWMQTPLAFFPNTTPNMPMARKETGKLFSTESDLPKSKTLRHWPQKFPCKWPTQTLSQWNSKLQSSSHRLSAWISFLGSHFLDYEQRARELQT